MTSTTSSMFSVLVSGHHLVIVQTKISVKRTLCMLDLRQRPSFYLDKGDVVCRDAQGREFILDIEDGVADELIAELAKVYKRARISTAKRVVGVLLLSLAAMGGISKAPGLLFSSPPPVVEIPRAQVKPVQPAPATVIPEDNGWTLPASVRASLPGKLQKAAERKLFTVDYSSDHARTLYVFADPSCPNCQRVEPLLQAAASAFNVVIFPVAVIGKEKSIAAITPVLCLPPEQRKAAWAALFDPGHDGLSLGQEPVSGEAAENAGAESGTCDLANKALGVNEVAYQTYRIPGTPWVIADDGRHVPQTLLRDPTKLQAFLNYKEASHGAE